MDRFPTSSRLIGKSASAYEHLRRAISRGQLRPGRRLSATGLAAAFRISETPVREALVRLSAEGFLDWQASKGHFTKPISLAEQADLHAVLGLALKTTLQAASGAAPERLDHLVREALAAPSGPEETSGAADRLADLIGALAAELAARGGNRVLVAIQAILADRTWLVRRLDLDSPARVIAARRAVIDLAKAWHAADRAAAFSVMDAYLARLRDRLPELVGTAQEQVMRATYP